MKYILLIINFFKQENNLNYKISRIYVFKIIINKNFIYLKILFYVI